MPTDAPKHRLNLIWLPNTAGLALTVKQHGSNQWPWSVVIGEVVVSDGVSPSMNYAQAATVEITVELAGKR